MPHKRLVVRIRRLEILINRCSQDKAVGLIRQLAWWTLVRGDSPIRVALPVPKTARSMVNLSQGVYSTLTGKYYYYPTESHKVKFQEIARFTSPSTNNRLKSKMEILSIV